METSTNIHVQTQGPMSFAKSFTILSILCILLVIGGAIFVNLQQHRALESKMLKAIDSTNEITYELIGGTSQINFYHAISGGEEYLFRVTPNLTMIDTFNITKRPEAGEYFKQHYQISW